MQNIYVNNLKTKIFLTRNPFPYFIVEILFSWKVYVKKQGREEKRQQNGVTMPVVFLRMNYLKKTFTKGIFDGEKCDKLSSN